MREEVIGDCRLILGDCRDKKFKLVVSCRDCDATWKPAGVATREPCPTCGKLKDVRLRPKAAKNLEKLKEWRAKRPGYSTEWERRYRRRALLVVGRGIVACVKCGCNRPELIEINHINGGGGKELRGLGNKWHRQIAKLERPVDDLNLLCKPCNAVHALELKHGALPFRIVWEA